MKNKFFITTMVLILVFLVSCGKNRTFKIKAINPVTGQGYAGLSYIITATKSVSGGEKKVFEETGFLNENGEAIVQLKVKPNRTYNIGCKEPPNTCYTKDIKFTYGIEDEANPTFQFEYAECANMKFKIKNINCQGPNDHFKLYYLGRQVAGQGTLFNGGLSVDELGCFDFEWPEFSQVPIGERYYKWEVTKNSITNTFYDTINLSENQFFIYEINY
jgi:hypothetical protein